jgi:hypothetical protein
MLIINIDLLLGMKDLGVYFVACGTHYFFGKQPVCVNFFEYSSLSMSEML